jgi:hypothetical protein
MNIPSWTYKTATVNNLEKIQQELKPLVEKYVPACFDGTQTPMSEFIPLTKEEVTSYSPTYVDMIKSTGFFDRWDISLLATASKLASNIPVIHIDHVDPEQRVCGLNIPLFNCEGTYTVWYDATIEYAPIIADHPDLTSARTIKYDLPYTEIDRLDASTPAWVNVSIPHRPYSEREDTRVIISARFIPELHEYFEKL